MVEEVRETFVYFSEASSVWEARVRGNSEFGDVKTNNPIPPLNLNGVSMRGGIETWVDLTNRA